MCFFDEQMMNSKSIILEYCKSLVVLATIMFCCSGVFAQPVVAGEKSLKWDIQEAEQGYSRPLLAEGGLKEYEPGIWAFVWREYLDNPLGNLDVEIINPVYQELVGFSHFKNEILKIGNLPLLINKGTAIGAGKNQLYYEVYPYRVIGSKIEILTRFELKVRTATAPSVLKSGIIGNRQTNTYRWQNTTVLSTGNWLKISVTTDGVYKITSETFKKWGINIGNIDPRTIRIHGHHGGMLPEKNNIFRYEDIPENAIKVEGEDDGVFNEGDFVLFYAQSPHKWIFNKTNWRYTRQTNLYSEKTYYFITWGQGLGKRITTRASQTGLSTDYTSAVSDYLIHHESEQKNLIKSGRLWFGEEFDFTTYYKFNETVPNIEIGDSMQFLTTVVARSLVGSSFSLRLNGAPFAGINLAPASADYTGNFINPPQLYTYSLLQSSSESVQLEYNYNKSTSSSKGWLDFYTINARRRNNPISSFFYIRDKYTLKHGVSEYHVYTTNSAFQIWDVTNPIEVVFQEYDIQADKLVYKGNAAGNLALFAAFNSSEAPEPQLEGFVSNQNLHSLKDVDYVMVAHPDFVSEAQRLATHHQATKNLNVIVVTPQQIYNEFSSGSQDLVAIRDFLRLLWQNASSPSKRVKYLLLFGDASYDYKDRVADNTNRVPIYQTPNSHDPIASQCSDDFFGFMDSLEGDWNSIGINRLDIGVGRFPVNTLDQAKAMVNKVLVYESKESFGDWRTMLTYIADDVDANWDTEHLDYCEILSEMTTGANDVFNVDKIYLDGYKQVSLGSGARYPDVNLAINKRMERGSLVVNYIGHGGENGLASERIVDIPQVNSWKNINSMPVFFTATCEFSRFDDPALTSAGEFAVLNANGGAVAAYTTIRIVNSGPNFSITYQFWLDSVFRFSNVKADKLGDIYIRIKNRAGMSANDRSFALLGDPAIRLPIPKLSISIDSINGHSVVSYTDTLKALSKVTFSGHVKDAAGLVNNSFNGILFPTIFDKQDTLVTLQNDIYSHFVKYALYNKVLYRGRAEVKNGRFKFSFVVPKDISYRYGTGRIALYAENGDIDAAGSSNKFYVGGAADSVSTDLTGPEIELYLNDESFINGGTVSSKALLVAKLYDENGINTTGTGIGREIAAFIDKGTKNERVFILNDFYQAALNSYQEGEIRYNMEGLEPGKHTLTLRVWDVYNNSSEVSIDFLVAEDEDITIARLLNYPNPFSTRTVFHFDHNKQGLDLSIRLQIFTISGKVVKDFITDVVGAPSHVSQIEWDGRDEFGDKLSKGVYIYRLIVRSSDGKVAEETEKLVILN